ncbi:MAG: hypothetical protein HRU01_23715 [Myxococcales bacterium]|nr:hypothetical protein [Myxococcales bacterium]
MAETKITFCRVCEATCGLRVEVASDHGRIEKLSGMFHLSGILVDVRKPPTARTA